MTGRHAAAGTPDDEALDATRGVPKGAHRAETPAPAPPPGPDPDLDAPKRPRRRAAEPDA